MATIVFIACAAALVVLLAGGLVVRQHLGPARTLGATLLTTIAALAMALAGAYAWDGPAIIAEGAGPMDETLPRFEEQLSEWSKDARRASVYNVWVLGDSTHQSRGPGDLRMVRAIRDAFEQKKIGDVTVHGVQNANCNAFEFYFLMNRLAEDAPDMVVMPLNLRAFGSRWLDDERNGFPVMERYIQWRHILEARRLSARGREITGIGIVLRKLDWAIFGSRAEWFLNGIKVRAEGRPQPDSDASLPGIQGIDTAPQRTREEALAWLAEYREIGETAFDRRIDDQHALVPVFHAIERLALEHGTGVMYYTVQTPDSRAQQISNFTALRWALGNRPGIRFVEMLDVLQREDFERNEHFFTSGMRRVASRLADEIILARDDKGWRATIPSKAADR